MGCGRRDSLVAGSAFAGSVILSLGLLAAAIGV